MGLSYKTLVMCDKQVQSILITCNFCICKVIKDSRLFLILDPRAHLFHVFPEEHWVLGSSPWDRGGIFPQSIEYSMAQGHAVSISNIFQLRDKYVVFLHSFIFTLVTLVLAVSYTL